MGKVYFNIVDSVKGGCGKSTFSIMLALALDEQQRLEREAKKTEGTNVCLVDMDLQGTSMAYLLFGRGIESLGIKSLSNAEMYLNEKVTTYQDKKKEKEYVAQVDWKDEDNKSHMFHVVLSSPKQRDKNRYKAVSSQNYSPEVLYSTFRTGLANMLGRDQLFARTPRQFKHVIFDMPPNSDGYSDAVFDCVMDAKHRVIESGDECNLFLVQTLDMGHRFATESYFQDFITRNQNNCPATRIFFVFNNVSLYGENDYGRHFNDAVAQIKKMLKKMSLSDKVKRQIYFVGIRFNEAYYRLCTTGDGIKNMQMPAGILRPVLFLENIDGPIGQIHTEDLLKVMEGREKDI